MTLCRLLYIFLCTSLSNPQKRTYFIRRDITLWLHFRRLYINNESSINYTMQLISYWSSFVWDWVLQGGSRLFRCVCVWYIYVVLWAARPAALGPHVAICRRASGRKSGARTSAMCSSSLQPPSPFFHCSTTFPLFCIYCMANFRYLCKLTHVIRHHISTFTLHSILLNRRICPITMYKPSKL